MPGHGTDTGGDRAPQRRQGSELTPEEQAALDHAREAGATGDRDREQDK